jgi:hypothetical protein
MQLIIYHQKAYLVNLELDSSASVRQVKEEIERQFKFKANDSSLFFSGQNLDNRRALAYYNLKDGDTLTLVTKSRASKVLVKYQSSTFIVDTIEHETIWEFKRLCAQKVNQRPDCLRIVCRGMTLFDVDTLRSLPNAASLHLVVVEYLRQLEVMGLDESVYPIERTVDSQISELKDELIRLFDSRFCPRSADLFCLSLNDMKLNDRRRVGDYTITSTLKVVQVSMVTLAISMIEREKFDVIARTSDSIDMLKTKILAKTDINKEHQRLTFARTVLQSEKTLLDCGIRKDEELKLHLCNRLFPLIVVYEDGTTEQLEVCDNDSVITVKAMIKSYYKHLIESQTLISDFTEMENSRPLSSYGINGTCTLQLVVLESWVVLKYRDNRQILGCELSDNVEQLKERIHNRLRHLPRPLMLVFNGVYLEEGTLASNGIRKGSSLEIFKFKT